MEFRATLVNDISTPASEATASLVGMTAALEAADKALKALSNSASAPAAAEKAADKAEKAATASTKAVEKATKDTAKVKAKAATEDEKLTAKSAKDKAKAHEDFATKVKNGANNVALASYAAAGAMLAYGLPLALGYRGMAKLQMIGAKATLDIRKLFTGVNPAPVLRAAERFTSMFSQTTATGRVLKDIVDRVFNGVFKGVEAAEPYVQAFVLGIIGGFLDAEIAILRARIALYPYTSILSKATAGIDGFSVAAGLGTTAVALLGAKAIWSATSTAASLIGMGVRAVVSLGSMAVSAGTATASMARLAVSTAAAAAPYLAVAAAIAAVCLALDQANKLSKEWDDNSSSQLWTKFKSDVGITSAAESQAEMNKRQGIVTGDEYDKLHPPAPPAAAAAPKAATPPTVPAAATAATGVKAGEALGDGLVAGMASKTGAVGAAGAALAKAADAGVRTEAQIRSPSRKMRRNAQYMGEGVELGLKDSKDAVQEAADTSLVPNAGKAPKGDTGAVGKSGGGDGLTVNFWGPVGGSTADFEAAARRAFTVELRDIAMAHGLAVK